MDRGLPDDYTVRAALALAVRAPSVRHLPNANADPLPAPPRRPLDEVDEVVEDLADSGSRP